MPRCDSRVNPETGRCVLSKGNVGQHVRGRPKKCTARYNPRTKRCVSKSRSSKSSPRSSPRRKQPRRVNERVPHNLHSLIENANEVHQRWNVRARIGDGCNGSVYKCCKDNSTRDSEYVIKIQRYNREAKAELEAYHDLKGTGLTPKLHTAWKTANKLYMVLDALVPCRPKATRMRVFSLLNKLEKHGWLHIDTHEGNVMCTKGRQKALLIDFGWAVKRSESPYRNHASGLRHFSDLRDLQEDNVYDCFK